MTGLPILDVLGGAVIGAVLGLFAQRVPLAPGVRSALSGALAYLGSAFVLGLVWAARIVDSGIVAVSFGLGEAALGFVVAAAVAAGLHVGLGAIAQPRICAHRPVVIGALAGAIGALAVSHGLGLRTS